MSTKARSAEQGVSLTRGRRPLDKPHMLWFLVVMPRTSEKAATNEAFLTIRLEQDLLAQLKERAKKDDRTVAATIRVAVREYLEQRDVG